MVRRYTDAELKKALSGLVIITDSREQKNEHITSWLDKKGVRHVSRALETGDYSVMLEDVSFEDEVVIERKAGLDELAGNFTVGRERFQREFIRAKANGTKVFLLIEDAGWTDVRLGNYRSQLKPQSLMASLLSWQADFNVTVIFCKSQEAGQIIHGILYYWVRGRLKRG